MKRRENLSEATSKTLFGIVFDLSDLARLGKRLVLPSLWITGNGFVAPEKNKSKNKRKVSWGNNFNYVVGFFNL